jgi:hypothetical protein
MVETTFNKVYPTDLNINQVISKNNKPYERRKRFRRSTIVYNFINLIVKNVYLINDDIDDSKKTE